MEKENNSDESETETPDLNSLKPFEFEPRTDMGDINSSQKQPQRCSVTKGVLGNFAEFSGKHLCARVSF